MAKKNSYALLGLAFGLFSFLSAYTIAIPIFITIPSSLILEGIFGSIFEGKAFKNVGISIIITYTVLFIIVAGYFYFKFINQIKSEGQILRSSFIRFLVLLIFIVHPLGFYCYMAQDWSMAKDGQIIMSAGANYLKSSIVFPVLGFLAEMSSKHK